MSTRKSGLLVWSTVSYFKETSTLWPKASKIFQDKEPIYLFHIIHWIYHMLDFIYLFLKYETMLFTCARWRAVSPPTFALSVFAPSVFALVLKKTCKGYCYCKFIIIHYQISIIKCIHNIHVYGFQNTILMTLFI